MAKGQKSRKTKVSSGTAKNKKNPQEPIALVLMGKGKFVSMFNNTPAKRRGTVKSARRAEKQAS